MLESEIKPIAEPLEVAKEQQAPKLVADTDYKLILDIQKGIPLRPELRPVLEILIKGKTDRNLDDLVLLALKPE